MHTETYTCPVCGYADLDEPPTMVTDALRSIFAPVAELSLVTMTTPLRTPCCGKSGSALACFGGVRFESRRLVGTRMYSYVVLGFSFSDVGFCHAVRKVTKSRAAT